LREGDQVADIGAAGGCFSVKFAERVGRCGRVFAVDKNPSSLQYVDENARNTASIISRLFQAKFFPTPASPIPRSGLCEKVFHHLQNPERYFSAIKAFLKADGRIAIIDHLPTRSLNFVNLFGHTTPLGTIEKHMRAAGYRLAESFDFLPNQSFTIWQ
jgi:ubiquinone/menaquinone biosynthesis C-methylase UbiE